MHGQFLPVVRPEIFEIVGGQLARAASVDDFIDDADRSFGQNAHRRVDDLKFVGTENLGDLEHFAFKGEQHIADFFLHEGVRGGAPSRLEHRNVSKERSDELLGRGVSAAWTQFRIRPAAK